MTTINTATPTSAAPINYAGAVTPDTLLLYCSTRIRSIDEQTWAQFNKQEQYRDVTQKTNSIQSDFASQGALPEDTKVVGNKEWCEAEEAKMAEAIKSAPENSDAQKKLEEKKQRFHDSYTTHDNTITKEEAKQYATEFGDLSKELGSSAELDMINLNSLISQRQTAIQMITNMIASLGETQKSIAAKMA